MKENIKYNNMRTRREIVDKENELYELANKKLLDPIRAIIYSDALEWVLGEDYLDFDYLKDELNDNN